MSPIARLVEQLSDGSRVDWQQWADDHPEHDHMLGQLRRLAKLTDAFRQCTQQPRSSRPGFQWGHLQVIELIGEGGFGQVYRAYDQVLDRDVALKLRREDSSSLASTRAFIAEARRLAQVRHPNVLAVHGAGVHDDRVGLWVDLLTGQTLAERIRNEPALTAEQRLQVALEVMAALAAIHEAGLIHGDVKAANVMIEASGRAILMDFGAGMEVRSADAQLAPVQGSPLCMAPELLEGARPSRAADLYSVGVLLYQMHCGRYPVTAASLDSLRQAHRRRRTRPSAALSGCPLLLARLIDDLLAVDPAQRPSADAALGRLRWLHGLPARRGRRRLIGTVLGGLTLALLISLFALHRVSQAQAQAEAQAVQAELQRQRAVAVKDFMFRSAYGAAPQQARSSSSLLALYQDMAGRLDTELAAWPEAVADLQVAVGRSLYDFGDHARGLALTEQGVTAMLGQAGFARQVEALESLAILYRQAQRPDDAEQRIRQALRVGAEGLDEAAFTALSMRAGTLLANLQGDRGRYLEALAQHRLVLAQRQQRYGEASPELAVNYNNMARTLEDMGRWPEALDAFGTAERLLEAAGDHDSIKLAFVRSGIARVLVAQGEYAAGVAQALTVRERFGRDYPQSHPYLRSIELILAHAELGQRQPTQALQRLERLLAEHPESATLSYWLLRARAAIDAERWHDATEAFAEVLASDAAESRIWRGYAALGQRLASHRAGRGNAPTSDEIRRTLQALDRRGLEQLPEIKLLRQWQLDSGLKAEPAGDPVASPVLEAACANLPCQRNALQV